MSILGSRRFHSLTMMPQKGQSIEDKLQAMKHFISGQPLSLVVLKATTSDINGPKKKHLNYLVNITNEPNASTPNLVRYFMKRAKSSEWTIVFKSLITIHHLINYGNEKFTQNLASSNDNARVIESLSNFVDKSSTLAYDMSTFTRRYSRYIGVKLQTYRSFGFDFCQIPENGTKRDMLQISHRKSFPVKDIYLDELSAKLTVLLNQFDALVAFDPSPRDLGNGVIDAAFSMLYQDFVRIYINYQRCIIKLLEVYFQVTQAKRAEELLKIYRKFLTRMEQVTDFMRVVTAVGLDTSDMPKLSRAPNLPLSTMESHIKNLDLNMSRRHQAIYGFRERKSTFDIPRPSAHQ